MLIVQNQMPLHAIVWSWTLLAAFRAAHELLVFVIRISVRFTSLHQRIASCLLQACCLCIENVAINFKTCIEAYFVKKSVGTLELLEVSKLHHKF